MKQSLLGIISLLCCAIAGSQAGQIPVVRGVVGGRLDRKVSSSGPAFKATLPALNVVRETTPGKLRLVENSGVCETTPGVYQASGYGDIAANKSIWFWYFAARSNPDTAPLALWFNGGPGASSMIGLFQEHGPCRITNDSSAITLNPHSWNNFANMLYIDQPIGTGFSHGVMEVGTSDEAASDVWTFLQIFLTDQRFSNLTQRSLALWTESYGGHYGPVFASHILSQNEAIASGKIQGVALNLNVLGIGNGLTDPLTQYGGYLTYAQNNSYHQLVSNSVFNSANSAWESPTGCKDQITTCNNGGSDSVCSKTLDFCNSNFFFPLAGNWDVYYVPTQNPDPYPPSFDKFISGVASKIGAEANFQESNDDVFDNFFRTGDEMRSKITQLESVVNAGVKTVLYNGDADFIVNFQGVESMLNILNTTFTPEFQQQSFQSYFVQGVSAGQFKSAGNFSYLRVFGAGHEVPAYKFGSLAAGQAAAQMFEQIMSNQSLTSTNGSNSNPGSNHTNHSQKLGVGLELISFWTAICIVMVNLPWI